MGGQESKSAASNAVQSSNTVGFALLQRLLNNNSKGSGGGNNVFISPASIQIAMTMTGLADFSLRN